MPVIAHRTTITANGEYFFQDAVNTGSQVLLEWDITAGTATVEPGYVSLSGIFKPARDLTGTQPVYVNSEGGSICLVLPASSAAALKVSSAAGGFSMIVGQSKVRN